MEVKAHFTELNRITGRIKDRKSFLGPSGQDTIYGFDFIIRKFPEYGISVLPIRAVNARIDGERVELCVYLYPDLPEGRVHEERILIEKKEVGIGQQASVILNYKIYTLNVENYEEGDLMAEEVGKDTSVTDERNSALTFEGRAVPPFNEPAKEKSFIGKIKEKFGRNVKVLKTGGHI